MTESTYTTNKRTVRNLYEACINEGALHLLDQLVAADYTGPRGEKGPEGFAGTIRGLRSGVPDIHFTIEQLVAEGDAVVVHWIWRGTHAGTLHGFAASRKALTNPGIALYHLRDGKIVRGTLQTDRLGLLQQIGLVPQDLAELAQPR